MLKWDEEQTIDGLTVYMDDTDEAKAYILPATPRFRIDDDGNPVFKFMKYKFPIDREDGTRGGGFLVCDVEFAVSDEEEAAVREVLQEQLEATWRAEDRPGSPPTMEIGRISYTRGTASVTILDSEGALVQKIRNPGAPSLYGSMILPITVELSPEGATLLESALQDKGGVVQVTYDVWTPVKLPPVTAHVWFTASKFMSFHQEIEVEERICSEDDYTETIRELISTSESGDVEIDPGTVTDQKVIGAVTDWAWQSLTDATTRMVLGEVPVQNPEELRKLYSEQDFENITQDVMSNRLVSFDRTYTQGQVMEWNPQPRGTLPNITGMTGPDGEAYDWEDFATTVDLHDPFFRTMTVNARANAAFDQLPLHSIEVKIEYDQGGQNRVEEYVLASPDDIGTFRTFVENNDRHYTYTYQVNYTGESEAFVSRPTVANDPSLVINVGDTGILDLEIAPGDLDFEVVRSAQVSLWYQDGTVPRREASFTLDAEHPTAHWTEVIFAPRRQPVHYSVKYFMADGREFESGEQTTGATELRVNDPFSAIREVKVRGFGDFTNWIDAIFVDLKYVDEVNDYSQTETINLVQGTTAGAWSFPVILADGGTLTYTANIRFKDGTVESIPETPVEGDTVMVGDVRVEQSVKVLADLVDWTTTRLVKVSLRHRAGGIDEGGDLIFTAPDSAAKEWIYPVEDPAHTAYSWTATYFKADNTTATVEHVDVTDETIVLPPTAG